MFKNHNNTMKSWLIDSHWPQRIIYSPAATIPLTAVFPTSLATVLETLLAVAENFLVFFFVPCVSSDGDVPSVGDKVGDVEFPGIGDIGEPPWVGDMAKYPCVGDTTKLLGLGDEEKLLGLGDVAKFPWVGDKAKVPWAGDDIVTFP